MATKMTKGKTRGNAAVLGTNQVLKKGGKVKKYSAGGMKKYKTKGQTGDGIIDKIKRNIKGYKDAKENGYNWSDMAISDLDPPRPDYTKTAGYAAAAATDGNYDPAIKWIKRKLDIKKKGGKVRTKKYLTGGTSEEEPSAPKAASAYKSKFTTYSPSGNYKSVSTEKSDATGTSRSTKTRRTAKGFVKNIFGSSDVPRASQVDNAMQKKKGGMVKSKSKKK